MDTSTISVGGMGTVLPDALFYDLSETVVYPFSLTPFAVEGDYNRAVLKEAMKQERLFAIFPELPPAEELECLPGELELTTFEFESAQTSISPKR